MDDDDEPGALARIRQLHPRIQRRRDLASSLNFPADLRETFGKFTESERAVLKIISGEVVRHDACTLTKDASMSATSASRRCRRETRQANQRARQSDRLQAPRR